MKKSIQVSLNKTLFNLEDDAYRQLEDYLESVRKYFKSYEDSSEIIDDIESRIAERLSELKKDDSSVVTATEVEDVIKRMGMPSDFGDDSTKTSDTAKDNSKNPFTDRRLMRDMENKQFAGVAAGLGAYFNIDPIIVRLLFVSPILISMFTGGSWVWDNLYSVSIWSYIALWIIMPEAKTMTDRMKMRGESITLDTIRENVEKGVTQIRRGNAHIPNNNKETMPGNHNTSSATVGQSTSAAGLETSSPTQSTTRPNTFGQQLGSFLKDIVGIIEKITPVIFKALGGLLFTVMVIATIALITTFFSLVINAESILPYISPSGLLNNWTFALVLGSALIIVIVPIQMLGTIGLSIARNKNEFNNFGTYTLVALWILSVTLLGSLGVRYNNEIAKEVNRVGDRVSAEFPMTERETSLDDFDRIEVSGDYKVKIVQSDEYKVVVEATDNGMRNIDITVEDEKLTIKNRFIWPCIGMCVDNEKQVTIYTPDVSEIAFHGATYGVRESTFQSDEDSIRIILSGASELVIDIDVEDANFELSGASKLTVGGVAEEVIAKASGASEIEGRFLQVQDADFELSGASNAEMFVSDKITGTASGASEIRYKGNATTDVETSGGSDIKRVK